MNGKRYLYHIFVSHNKAQKDWVRKLVHRLRDEGLLVFFDEDSIQLGEDIVAAIEKALRFSRHILLVLSPEALDSHWVELEWSMSLYRDPNAAARSLIPILKDDCDIPLALSRLKYLDARDADFERQVKHLLKAIDRNVGIITPSEIQPEVKLKEAVDYFIAGGTMPADSVAYVERKEDYVLWSALQQPHGVATIWGPRQSGKSSMIVRALKKSQESGRHTVMIDFSALGGASFPQVLFTLASIIAKQLKINSPEAERYAHSGFNPQYAFAEFLSDISMPSVIALDEIDFLQSIGALDTFFRMLRAIISSQSVGEAKNIFFLVSSVLSPIELIEDDLSSPFNIGHNIRLSNFSDEEATSLITQSRIRLFPKDIEAILSLTGGQPYLIHRTAYLLDNGKSLSELIDESCRLDGPFGTHLHMLQSVVEHSDKVHNTLIKFQSGQNLIPTEKFELSNRGILRLDNRLRASFSCDLYRRFFLEYLAKKP